MDTPPSSVPSRCPGGGGGSAPFLALLQVVGEALELTWSVTMSVGYLASDSRELPLALERSLSKQAQT